MVMVVLIKIAQNLEKSGKNEISRGKDFITILKYLVLEGKLSSTHGGEWLGKEVLEYYSSGGESTRHGIVC